MQRGYLNGLIWTLGIGLAMAIPGKWGTAREEVKTNSSEMGSLVLARDGVGEAVIVVGKQPTVAAAFAAQELQEHVRKITGAILPIVREDEKIQGQCIYVGESEGTRKYGLTNGSFAAQEYTIKFVPDGLILMGRDKDNSAASLGAKDSAGPQVELHGGFKWREGKYGKGLSFSNGVLVVNELGFKDEEGTLEAWVWLPAGGNKEGGEIMRLEGGNPYGYHIVSIRPANRVAYTVYNDKTKKASVVNSGELGEGWHYVMAVHDMKKGKMGLAVDGVSCGEGEYQEATACSGAVLKIGGFLRDGKVSNGFEGGVDELRVSNLARPVGKAAGPFSLDFNTLCLMHFDEGDGIPGKTTGRVNPPDMFDEQGTSYAAHDFLERFCDVRWYGPTELGMVCPERTTLEVNGQEVRRKPVFPFRALYPITPREKWERMTVPLMNKPTEKDMRLFWSRLRVGGEDMGVSHSFYGYYDRFWKKNPEHPELFEGEHPEYFSKDWPAGYKEKYGERYVKHGSKNRPDQMCYSNPGFINQVVQDARDFFDGKGLKPGAMAHGDFFALEPMDTGFWCICPACQKLIDETQRRTNEWQTGITSDYLFDFANKVAREIKKSHPDKWIYVLSYGDHGRYPRHVNLESNIAVQICLPLRNWPWSPRVAESDMGIYHDWLKKMGDRRPITFWFYYCFPAETGVMGNFNCFPGFFAHYADRYIKMFAADGCAGAFLCGLGEQVDTYVTMKLFDNPALNVDQLLDEFFGRYYGAAAKPMRRMYLRIEEIYCDPNNYPESVRSKGEPDHQTEEIAWKYLGTEKRMTELGRWMEEAKAKAQTDIEKQRVALFEKGVWEYMKEGRKKYFAGEEKRRALAEEREARKEELAKRKEIREKDLEMIKTNPPTLPQIRVPRIAPPASAGELKGVDWSKGVLLTGWRQVEGVSTARKIEGRLVHDGQYLYIQLREEIKTSLLVTGNDIWSGDDWEIFFAPERGKKPYYQLAVSPKGVHEEYFYSKDAVGSKRWDGGVKFISDVSSAGQWVVSVAVPLNKIFPQGVKPGDRLFGNFYRQAQPNNEIDRELLAWSPNLEKNFHNLDRLGEIVLE